MIRKLSAIFILISALVWQGCTTETKELNTLSAIPVNAPIVIEIHNLKTALEQINTSNVIAPFLGVSQVSQFKDLIQDAALAVKIDPTKFKGKIFAFAHISGAGKYNWTLVTSAKNFENFNLFKGITVAETKNYDQAKIYKLNHNTHEYFATNFQDIVVLSPKENLVEDVIRQLVSGVSLDNDRSFKNHQKIANSSDPISIYLNLQNLPDYTKTIINLSKPDWLNQLGTWAELDVYADEKGVFFNGAIINSDSTNFYFNSFKKTGNCKISAAQIIPANTVAAVMFGTDNFSAFSKNFTNYLKKKNLLRNYTQALEQLDLDLNKDFYPYLDGEFGIAYAEPKGDIAASKMAYIKIKKPDLSVKQLVSFTNGAVENYREYPIYKINKEKLLPLALGRAFKGLNHPYFAVHEEWVFFCNDALLLKSAINDWIAQKQWSESESFQSVASQFSDKANIWAFYKNPAAYNLLTSFLDGQQLKNAKANNKIFKDADWFSIQFKNKGDAQIISGLLTETPEVSKEASQVWALNVGAPIHGQPQFIYNHSTHKNDLIIQNQNNELYWIDPSGKVLWKKQLDAPILGEIEQIDLFKNNKLQLAFTTKNGFYVIDRLGNNVDPFPIKIEGITAPLAVFDYDKTRNYRFLICAGNSITNYNGQGQVVDGWQFKKTTSPISVRPKHYTLSGRDYIIVAESNGTINILNRKGETRIEIDKKFNVIDNIYMEAGPTVAESRLITINNEGYIKYLLLNNKLDSVDVNFTEIPNHFDFDGNSMAFTAGDYLIVKDQTYPFKIDANEKIEHYARIFKVNNDRYYTFTTNNNKVHAFNAQGKLLQGFPVYGSSAATIGRFSNKGKSFMIVGTEDGQLYLYRLTE